MSVEVLIYAYLVICLAMILFNVISIFVFEHNDKELDIKKDKFTKVVEQQIAQGEVDEEHKNYIYKKLLKTSNLMGYEETLKNLYKENEEGVHKYLSQLIETFKELMFKYNKRENVQSAYFPYIISEYEIFKGLKDNEVNYLLIEQLKSPSIYNRENALCAIYSIGDEQNIFNALKVIDKNKYYHHQKLISDGLFKYCKDNIKLHKCLWNRREEFSIEVQIAILDYLRFSTDNLKEQMFELLSDEYDSEINYCAIRYFGRYYYEPAYEKLIGFLESEDDTHWEYKAITATAIATYPSDRTTNALKECLKNPNWYVRYNASQTLKVMGMDYDDLRDIFEGDDRFAGDIMRYRIDQKKYVDQNA